MKLSHSIEIAAPGSLVWEVSTDINNWGAWLPTVQAIERIDDGPFRMASEAWVKQPGLPKARWTVTAIEEGRHFTWETHIRGMHIIARHELLELPEGTRNTLELEFRGLAVWLMAPFVWFSARRSLRLENVALKQRCEELRESS